MKTDFSAEFLATDAGARANEILRACVHCGFCNATCPTYQLTGDELDGPRGRIYLMRELLESGENTDRTTRHLDRCLTCRACETTCPSGVAYGELAEIARNHIGPERKGMAGPLRSLLQWMVPEAARLRWLSRLGRMFRIFVPRRLAAHIPVRIGDGVKNIGAHQRRVLLLNGCAQQVTTADTNQHLSRLLDNHGVSVAVAAEETCCGSLELHLGDEARALARARRNIDALSPLMDDVEAIISTASGCGVTIKDYGRLLAHDEEYASRAAAISAKARDVSEYLGDQHVRFSASRPGARVAWHAPCTLQHGQQLGGQVERMLSSVGYELVPVRDAHLCCGSAGTYSLLQPAMSEQLRSNKLDALCAGQPDLIASANVGCQTHLAHGSEVEVLHWIELLK